MADQPEIPSVSMSNTKKELMEAYEAAKQRLQSLNKNLLNAETTRKRLEKELAKANADTQAAKDPLQRLHDLRGAISRELTDLGERFEAEIETYRKVKSAVEAKQDEIKTLYEVETAASDLAALIDAQRAKKEQFELEMEEQKAAFEEEMRETKAIWNRTKTEHERQVKEESESIEKQRQREKEEYEYMFAREQDKRKNVLEDELHALEKEISQKREVFEQEHQQRQDELNRREVTVTQRENEINELEKEVATFPKRLENAVKSAIVDTTEKITGDFEKDKALMESKFEGEKNVLIGKIQSLEKMVESQTKQIADLSKRQEQAYEKVQDIANRAVAAAKREVYATPASAHVPVPVRDENKSV
jgi:chromosome segregation ATPase